MTLPIPIVAQHPVEFILLCIALVMVWLMLVWRWRGFVEVWRER